MPRIYRSMRSDADDKPAVDTTGKGLGVRAEPVNNVVDVDVDDQGNVLTNGKGMSVAPNWRDLPYFLIPKRLQAEVKGARGSNSLYCFAMGEGEFRDGDISDDLSLTVDSRTHGVVAPKTKMPIRQFQAHLAATRPLWEIDES